MDWRTNLLSEEAVDAIKNNDVETLSLYPSDKWNCIEHNDLIKIKEYLLDIKRIKLIDVFFNKDMIYIGSIFISHFLKHKYIDGIISMSKYFDITKYLESYVIIQQDINLLKMLIGSIPIDFIPLINCVCKIEEKEKQKENEKILIYLLEYAKDNKIKYMDSKSLESAIFYNLLNIVKILVRYGYIGDGCKKYVLYAANHGRLVILKYFIEIGEDVHMDNDILLSIAVIRGNLNMVKYLTSLGLKLNPINNCLTDSIFHESYNYDGDGITFHLIQMQACKYIIDNCSIDRGYTIYLFNKKISDILAPFVKSSLERKYNSWLYAVEIMAGVHEDIWREMVQFM